MKRFLLSLAALAFMAAPSVARAETQSYRYDTVHTQIMFFVSHLGFSISEGEFLDFDGSINLDMNDPSKSNVDVTIKTDSIDMDDEKWNEHMKSADFFDVEQYPTMTFKSTNVEVTGDDTAKVTGDLTILDVTKPVTLDVKLNKIGDHPMNKKPTVGFSATARIKRSDFGMEYALPMVGDDVDIRIEVEANGVESVTEDMTK